MPRPLWTSLALLAVAATARAHFVFVVPDANGQTAKVILSESLEPDTEVPIDIVAGTKLNARAAGHDTPLPLEKADHAFNVPINGNRLIFGTTDLGVVRRGEAKPGIIVYFPKTILGDPFDPNTRLGDAAVTELVPVGVPGNFKLQFLVAGKPVAHAEVDLLLPDGKDDKVQTDADGFTPPLTAAGRYGAWARHVDATAGEQGGKHYDEIRHYATLVFDAPAAPTVYPPLPQKASSFGAVASDGWLYVYGGHVVDTHAYSTASVSGQFHRLNLAGHQTWETLPGGPALQGMNLAADRGKVYRVGGMRPANKPGAPADVRSVADAACFDPATGQWTALPPLPQPRSSHDLVVLDHTLYVVGGWTLDGDPSDADFRDDLLSLDLTAADAQWKSVKQPFQRRAMIAAAHGGKLYVIGGFDTDADPSRRVDIYDPSNNTWTRGPGLPAPDENGFGPAAAVSGDTLYVSVGDGSVYRLNDQFDSWDKAGSAPPRIVHRMVASGAELLIIGGASGMKQLDRIDTVALPRAAPSTRPARRAATRPAGH